MMLPLIAGAEDIETVLPKAQAGDVKAMVQLAEIYSNSWDEGAAEKAVSWYKKAAAAGNAEAMFKLYEAYSMSLLGLESNDDVAKEWLDKSAAKGYGEAFYVQGTKLMFEDEAKSMKLITQGAEAGSGNAQLHLAKLYSNSWYEGNNPAKAFEWAKKSAEQNVGEAQYLLATFYLKGVGTTPNKTEAVKWLKKACENDFSTAKEIMEWL